MSGKMIDTINVLCELVDAARYEDDIPALERVGEICKLLYMREPTLKPAMDLFYTKLYHMKANFNIY